MHSYHVFRVDFIQHLSTYYILYHCWSFLIEKLVKFPVPLDRIADVPNGVVVRILDPDRFPWLLEDTGSRTNCYKSVRAWNLVSQIKSMIRMQFAVEWIELYSPDIHQFVLSPPISILWSIYLLRLPNSWKVMPSAINMTIINVNNIVEQPRLGQSCTFFIFFHL